MRTYILLLIVLCGSLLVPAFAAESSEALSKRISELEKANFVLHEDLARNRIALDMLIEILQQDVTTLDTQTNEQNDSLQNLITKTIAGLQGNIDGLQQQLAKEMAMRDELEKNLAVAAKEDDLAAQKELLGSVQTSIANTKKDLQDNLEALMQLLSQEIALRVAQTNDASSTIKGLQGNLAAMQQALDQEAAVRAAQTNDPSAATSAQVAANAAATKGVQKNLEAIQQLLNQEIVVRVGQTNNAAAVQKDVQGNIEALLQLLSQQIAVRATLATQDTAATHDEFRDNVSSMQKLLDQEVVARESLANDAAAKNSELSAKISKMEKSIAELAAREAQGGHAHTAETVVLDPNEVERTEVSRFRIVNAARGEITASHDAGKTWETVGHVLAPAVTIRDEASSRKWAPVGVVAGTAVGGIDVRTGYDATSEKEKAFSILPKDASMKGLRRGAAAAIQTDMTPGNGIFGDKWSPLQGNPVFLDTPAGLMPIREGYAPKIDDVLVVRVMQMKTMPQAYVFENVFGGFVSEVGWAGRERVIGQVLMPVSGIGHFERSAFTDTGRLSASQGNVIDVSVAPPGKTGGFRIMLGDMSMDEDMTRARSMPQYMVVGEFDARDPSWQGMAPLFLGSLRPNMNVSDLSTPDWLNVITSRVSVDVRINKGPWQPMPAMALDPDPNKPMPEWAQTAMKNITHVRINLPVPQQTR